MKMTFDYSKYYGYLYYNLEIQCYFIIVTQILYLYKLWRGKF